MTQPAPVGGVTSFPDLAGLLEQRPRWRKARWVIAAAAVLVVAAGAVAGVTDPFKSSGSSPSGVTDNSFPTSLVTITRRTISQQTSVPATLGYAGSYSPVNQASGFYTALPAAGQVVSEGQVLYQVDGDPVVLLYGPTPAYRMLSEGTTGADVTELNADLVAMGEVTASELSPTSNSFSYWTRVGVERLQAALGVTQSGSLNVGEAVFLPSAVRVTGVSGELGGTAQAGEPVLECTSTAREVTVELGAGLQSEVKKGDRVVITLPDSSTTPGVVTSVGTVATSPSSTGSGGGTSGGGDGGNPTVTVEIAPTDPAAAGSLDQAPVTVSITNTTVPDALVVPINALVALSGGRYALEAVDPAGVHRLIDVSVGLVDDADNLIQVTGSGSSGLTVGERVVVPST
jgi:hypothetical protein